jgi:hypothetical protein
MRRLLPLLLLLSSTHLLSAQTIVFHENFDPPSNADSVTVSGTPTWSLDTFHVSSPNGFHNTCHQGDTSYVVSQVFSAVGNTFVQIEFDQICKIEFFDFGILEVSTDGGSSWTQLTANEYLGAGNFGVNGNKFASNSYFDWQPANPSAMPTQAWWKHETFDVSTLLGNESNCRFRFQLRDGNNGGSTANYGWVIDNIKITVAPSELIPPTVEIVPPIISGAVTQTGPFPISVEAEDGSGIDSVLLIYNVNGGLNDTIDMAFISGNLYVDSIPAQIEGDTICYYVEAYDGSPAHNMTRDPISGCIVFVPVPIPPVIVIGTGTNTNSNTQYPAPYGTSNTAARHQMIITAQELSDLGLTGPIEIRGLGFDIATNASHPMKDFTVKMKNHTGSFSSWVSGLNTYYTNILYTTNTGWTNHQFSTPFVWDGVSDIVIETCFDNAPSTASNANANHYYTTYSSTKTIYRNSNFTTNLCNVNTFNFSSNNRVNMRLTLGDPLDVDAGLQAVLNPVSSGCDLGASEDVILEVVNFGTDTLTYVPLGYQIDANTAVLDTMWTALPPGDTANFTFAQTADLSSPGTIYSFKFWCAHPDDLGFYNDSIKDYVIENTTVIPYWVEDFETFATGQIPTNFWEQSPQNDVDWTFMSGATWTTGTGPSYDHTTGTLVGKYAHMDASSLWFTAGQASLISPCIMLDSLDAPKVKFYYHMYGAQIGTLYVDILGDNGVWTNLWSLSGDQGNMWHEQTLNISGYSGEMVKLRFTAEHSGNGGLGDIAIDDISVYEPSDHDLAVTMISEPIDGNCKYTSAETVRVEIVNFGLLPADDFTVSYQVNGGTVITETITDTLHSGDTLDYTFTTVLDMSVSNQNYHIIAYPTLSGDTINDNDTVIVDIFFEPYISSLPHIEDFEDFTPGQFWNTPGQTANGWKRIPEFEPNRFHWYVWNGPTTTGSTGPSGDHTPSMNDTGNYMFTETNWGSLDPNAYLYSPCIDFSNATTPYLEFFYHRYGSNMSDGFIEAEADTGWVTLDTLIGDEHVSGTDSWTRMIIPLTDFAGEETKLRWRSYRSGTLNDWAIDDVRLYEPDPWDVEAMEVTAPTTSVAIGAPVTVSFSFFNLGSNTITSMSVGYSVNGGTPVYETFSGSVAPNTDGTYTFTTTYNAPGGSYDLCVFTDLTSDANALNDTTCTIHVGVETITVPYFDDFESGQGSWVAENGYLLWELGQPSGNTINSAASGQNAWVTNLDGYYEPFSDEDLLSPYFELDSNIQCELRFKHKYNSEPAGDGCHIQYSIDEGQTWNVLLANMSTNVHNWYNFSNHTANNLPGWSGSVAGWDSSAFLLDSFNFLNSTIRFKFNFASNQFNSTFDGWGIDDFEIFVPIQHSASPKSILAGGSNSFILPGAIPITTDITNTGVRALHNADVTVYENGVPVISETVNFNPPLEYLDTATVQLIGQWSAAPGTHEICLVTTLPNYEMDDYPEDDSICLTLAVFDSTGLYPYCNNFDDTSVTPWITLDSETYGDSSIFEQGIPDKPYIAQAYSAPNVWMTGLSANYEELESSALFTPVFNVKASKCYRIEFRHKFLTEAYLDGGTVEWSQDGLNWNRVGQVFDPHWFNSQFISGLGPNNPGVPGWSGTSTGWVPAINFVEFPVDGPGIFRFRFGSDASIGDEGWAIDDFCLEEYQNCNVSIAEFENDGFSWEELYPNPTSGVTNLLFHLKSDAQIEIVIIDALGKLVHHESLDAYLGDNRHQMNLKHLENGIYFVHLNYLGMVKTKKLVIAH